MKRYLTDYIIRDLKEKIVLLSGPRQSGKTTLSQALIPSERTEYFNYDNNEHRQQIKNKMWKKNGELIILDELHKMKLWKSWLKGIWDTGKKLNQFLVTGSARLDTYKKVGDSLAGRFFQFRLHPLDLKELNQFGELDDPQSSMQKIMEVSGFPEPYLRMEKNFYNRWKKGHLDIILKQDILFLENLKDINSLEMLVELLRDRVGSPISYLSLAEDLGVSDKTVKNWIRVLENAYVVFSVNVYHKNISRSKIKNPKIYFYDIARVKDEAARFENLVACALIKEVHKQIDCDGNEFDLYYLRTRDGQEIDFYIRGDKCNILLECKMRDNIVSKNFKVFEGYFSNIKKIQLVYELEKEYSDDNKTQILKASKWLKDFSF